MSHFAEINENNVVLRVIVVPNEQEHRGQEFLAIDLRLGGTWIQTSYNNKIRNKYATIGDSYLPEEDIFVSQSPYPSWSLDKNHEWQPPVPRPNGFFFWDEQNKIWKTAGNM